MKFWNIKIHESYFFFFIQKHKKLHVKCCEIFNFLVTKFKRGCFCMYKCFALCRINTLCETPNRAWCRHVVNCDHNATLFACSKRVLHLLMPAIENLDLLSESAETVSLTIRQTANLTHKNNYSSILNLLYCTYLKAIFYTFVHDRRFHVCLTSVSRFN